MNEVTFLVLLEPLFGVFVDGEELKADDHALVVRQGLDEDLIGGTRRRRARLLEREVVDERLPVVVVERLHVALSLHGLHVDSRLLLGEADLVLQYLLHHLSHAFSE